MSGLLTASDVRSLAAELNLHPTKRFGQNFVIDGNTVRRIVSLAAAGPRHDVVLEVGPGLGSLTLGLLAVADAVVAVEIDPVLAGALPATVMDRLPDRAQRLTVIAADAMSIGALDIATPPTALVANLPYNVSVPVLLHLLSEFPTIGTGLVMVQKEVGERLAAGPGSRTYGVPSAKLAWFAKAAIAGAVPRSVFWPVPNVDSVLVGLQRCAPPQTRSSRRAVFEVIDAAFSQRRKMLRSALADWAGSPGRAEAVMRAAGVDPTARGETLVVQQFAAICDAAAGV